LPGHAVIFRSVSAPLLTMGQTGSPYRVLTERYRSVHFSAMEFLDSCQSRKYGFLFIGGKPGQLANFV
jgi:hypothetical protein